MRQAGAGNRRDPAGGHQRKPLGEVFLALVPRVGARRRIGPVELRLADVQLSQLPSRIESAADEYGAHLSQEPGSARLAARVMAALRAAPLSPSTPKPRQQKQAEHKPDHSWRRGPVPLVLELSRVVTAARLRDPDGEGVTKWKRLHSAAASPTAMSFAVVASLYPHTDQPHSRRTT